jgi:prevent-host-death family protein
MLDLSTAPTWTLVDAKAHLSELVDQALAGHPQIIARRGDPPIVVVAQSEIQESQETTNALELFQRCPGEFELLPRAKHRRAILNFE